MRRLLVVSVAFRLGLKQTRFVFLLKEKIPLRQNYVTFITVESLYNRRREAFYRTLTEILCIYRLLLFYVDLFFLLFFSCFLLNVFHSSDAYTHSDFDTRVHIVFGLILLYSFFFFF